MFVVDKVFIYSGTLERCFTRVGTFPRLYSLGPNAVAYMIVSISDKEKKVFKFDNRMDQPCV